MSTNAGVDQDENDFSRGTTPIANIWQVIFFSLDCIVMLISLFLNMCLVRAVARNIYKETPLYFFIVFIFFTSLVDDALIIEHFMTLFGHQQHTNSICQFFMFATLGNRLLQVNTVLALLYYSWICLEQKKTSIEQNVKLFFPLILLGLIFLEIIFASAPASQVRGSKDFSKCLYKDDVTENGQRVTGWLFMVLFPYYLPLAISIFPILRITNRLRKGTEVMTERSKVQNYIVLCISGGYFFFHLLYYLLMFGREVEFVAFEVSNFRMMLRRPIWFITRPMFALIGYGWHIIVPLTPFVFDPDLFDSFPGQYVNRKRLEIKRNDPRNNIILTPKSIPMTFPQSSSGETRSKIGTEFSNPGLPSETNSSESNSKSSTMGSTASATDSFSHVNAISNVISENNDQENNKKGQPTWTQFDEVDIESREYNNKLYYTVEM